jgi:hypothetical protein
MTTEQGHRVPLDGLDDGRLAILREEANDWLVAKADDLPRGIDDAEGAKCEAEEVAALGRLFGWLRRGEILMPDPIARELIARATTENIRLDELKKEYDQELGRHESWAALLAHLDTAPDTDTADAGVEGDPGTEPESPDKPGPVAFSTKWIGLAGRSSDDQLRIVRSEVIGYLVGRAGDLHLLHRRPDPEREVGEIAALARLAFWLERGEIQAPDRIAHETVVRLAEGSDELNEYERLRERYEAGIAEHEALRALAAIFADAPTGVGGPRGQGQPMIQDL